MLPSSYPVCNYSFIVDSSGPLRLVFTSATLIERARTEPTEPLWFREMGNQQAMEAAVTWVRLRRALWPAWGEMAETSGRAALESHMHQLFHENGPAEAVGFVVHNGESDRELALGDFIATSSGPKIRIYYQHRFETAELRNTFRDWLLANNPEGNGGTLLEIALNRGTGELAGLMDDIASEEHAKLILN